MLLFDCETNGFLEVLDSIHCLVIKDTVTGEVFRYRGADVEQGVRHLAQARPTIGGHNVIKFDIPALTKVYPWFQVQQTSVVDTLVLSRLIYPDLGDVDDKLIKAEKLPKKFWKRHSLEAWGHRLGNPKAEYTAGWDNWSQEMEDYCAQDCETLHTLYTKLTGKNYSQRALDLEHQVQWACAAMETKGVLFDEQAAAKLYAVLSQRREELRLGLADTFKPRFLPATVLVPKRDNKASSYTAGAALTKIKDTEFNPGSRHHIAEWLKQLHGWAPTDFTPTGEAKVDETVLLQLPYPEAKYLGEYFLIEKRIGMLAEGNEAWLRHVKPNGRIHGSIITNGAVTGRATHSRPNLGQVPASGSPYGAECRSLFTVPAGKAMVGADLSGLELRCLAHYMAKWDGGAYGKVLLEGDIHTANMHAAGLSTRDQAKTFAYAWLYGAGAAKLGSLIGKGAGAGNAMKKRFLAALPALASLMAAVQSAANTKGYLVGLDGRLIPIRSAHSALNTLLQSAGAILAKQAMANLVHAIQQANYGHRAQIVLWVHDEFQIECDMEISDEIGKMAVEAMQQSGRDFGIRLPITGEYKIGRTWAETH